MVQTYAKTEPQERVVGSLIERVTRIRASDTPFFGPKRSLLTTEALLVCSWKSRALLSIH
jgi:hypothetical protein